MEKAKNLKTRYFKVIDKNDAAYNMVGRLVKNIIDDNYILQFKDYWVHGLTGDQVEEVK